jgi:hypothetical protein
MEYKPSKSQQEHAIKSLTLQMEALYQYYKQTELERDNGELRMSAQKHPKFAIPRERQRPGVGFRPSGLFDARNCRILRGCRRSLVHEKSNFQRSLNRPLTLRDNRVYNLSQRAMIFLCISDVPE